MFTNFKSDMASRVDARKQKAADKAKTLRAVHQAVDRRDGRRCRACKGVADPQATDMLKHGHRHHIVFRSLGGTDTTANLLLLCAPCHREVHLGRLSMSGNADGDVEICRVILAPTTRKPAR